MLGLRLGLGLSQNGGGSPQIALSADDVSEDAIIGTTIGTLSVPNDTGWSFAITADPDNKFDLSGDDLITTATFDYETATSHSVTIEATKVGEDTRVRTFNIGVVNVFEAATLGALSVPASVTQDTVVNITGATSGSTITGTMPTGWTLDGAARTITIAADAPLGAQSWSLTETLADSSNSPRTSTGSSTVAEASAAAMRAVSGSYTGDGAVKEVGLPFVPDVVFVWREGQSIIWRNRASWHGRTQYFSATGSAYLLQSSASDPAWLPFRQQKFAVPASYSSSAQAYNYLALKTNGTDTLEELSIIGNAVNGRQVDWTSRRTKLMMTKRDSARAMVWTEDGEQSIRAPGDPLPTSLVTINDNGMAITDSQWVNENNNVALGEAIEYLSFIEQDGVKVVRHTGTGGSTTVSGLGDVVFIIDASQTAKGQTCRTGGSGVHFDGTSTTNPVSLSGGVLTLPAAYNVASTEYLIVSFDDTASADVDVDADPTASLIAKANGAVTLSSGLSLSGACSYEFYGKVRWPVATSSFYYPLLMLGNGTDNATSGMNGGIYLYRTDPDGNGWEGPVLRVIQSNYLARQRVSPHASINYYNMNTGIVIPPEESFHVVVTHNGSGKWRVYLNGKLAKEHNLDIHTAAYGNRTNGGGGTSLPVYAGGRPSEVASTDLYRIQIWDTAITDAQARGLFANAQSGAATNVSGAVLEADFRDNSPPGITGYTQGPVSPPLFSMPRFFRGTGGSTSGIPTIVDEEVRVTSVVGTNGRAFCQLLPAGTYNVRSVIRFDNATRIIARTTAITDTEGATGTTVFDITGTGTIDRTDTISAPSGLHLFYVGVMANGQHFTILPETTAVKTA